MDALLICEDGDEAAILGLILQRSGLTPQTSKTVENAMERWHERPVDLILLATKRGGLADLVRRLRQESEVPLVVISSLHDEDALCAAYAAGADAVITRPYSPRLTLMQLRAVIRRGKGTVLRRLPTMSAGDLTLDPTTRMVQVGEHPARRLTQLEFRLLYTLMLNRGQTLPTATIVELVWAHDGEGGMELVRNLVSRLRAKIEHPRTPRHIITDPGVGYRLRGADE